MATQYQGYDVLEIEPDMGAQTTSGLTRSVYLLDSSTGKIAGWDRTGVAAGTPAQFAWLIVGRAEVDAFCQFLAARAGMAVPFWLPTCRRDLLMTEDLPAASTEFSIARIGYARFMFDAPARRHLAFLLADGSRLYRKITAAAEAGATETLTLDSSPGVVVATATKVSFLLLARLATDQPEIQWLNRDVAQAALDLAELPLEVPA